MKKSKIDKYSWVDEKDNSDIMKYTSNYDEEVPDHMKIFTCLLGIEPCTNCVCHTAKCEHEQKHPMSVDNDGWEEITAIHPMIK